MEAQPITDPQTLLLLLVALETSDGQQMPIQVDNTIGLNGPQLLHYALSKVLPTQGLSTSEFRMLALNELEERGLVLRSASPKGRTQLRVPIKVIRSVEQGGFDLDQLESLMRNPPLGGINITLHGPNYGQVGTGVNRQEIGSIQVGYQDFRQSVVGFVKYGLSVEEVFSIIDTLQDEVRESGLKEVGGKTEGKLRQAIEQSLGRAGKVVTGAAVEQGMKQLLPLLGALVGLGG